MVVDNFDLICMTAVPLKAEPPLVIDANAVLALAVSN